MARPARLGNRGERKCKVVPIVLNTHQLPSVKVEFGSKKKSGKRDNVFLKGTKRSK